MRAIALNAQRQFVELDLPTPECGAHDVLVRVRALAVNPIDLKQRAALAPEAAPKILGWDAAGEIVAVGTAVRAFQPGDHVYYAGELQRPGCNAELQAVQADLIAPMPTGLSFAEAAALPLTALTAWEALFERLRIPQNAAANAGRSLLIIGAGGGVGSIAIQLAKRAGLTVFATASRTASADWCRACGADFCLDHHGDLVASLRACGYTSVNYILNCHSVDTYWHTMATLIQPGGWVCCLASAATPLDLNVFKTKSAGVVWEFVFTRSLYSTANRAEQGQILQRIADGVMAGELRSTLTANLGQLSVYTLESAHTQLASQHTLGKLVLEGL